MRSDRVEFVVRFARENWFLLLLLAISVGALLPRLQLGASEAITYDGYWNIFMDTQDRWQLFFHEYSNDQHPILFRFLLRAVAQFGRTRLIYRLASILPGVAAVFVLGEVARKLYRTKSVALLAAAAYGFSLTIISLNVDIRDYSLALFFVVSAFYFFVDFLSSPGGSQSLLWFGVCSSLAIGTEYYSIFFVLPCFVIQGGLYLRERALGRADSIVPHGNPYLLSAALWLPVATTIYLYNTHLSRHPTLQNNVLEFYWRHGTPAFEFLLKNLNRDLNYLSPLDLHSSFVLAILLIVAVPVALYFGFVRPGFSKDLAAATPALVLTLLLSELAVLAVRGSYPFGGYERQQSIVFPFLILTAFLFLDWFVVSLPQGRSKAIVLGATMLLVSLNFAYWWPRWPRNHGGEIFVSEYADFQTLPPAQAVFVDQLSLIGFYVHTHCWTWRFDRSLYEPNRLDLYRVKSPADGTLLLIRDFDWSIDLFDPGTYRTIERSLRATGLTDANVFRLGSPSVATGPGAEKKREDRIRKAAEAAGLKATTIIYKTSVVCVHLSAGA